VALHCTHGLRIQDAPRQERELLARQARGRDETSESTHKCAAEQAVGVLCNARLRSSGSPPEQARAQYVPLPGRTWLQDLSPSEAGALE